MHLCRAAAGLLFSLPALFAAPLLQSFEAKSEIQPHAIQPPPTISAPTLDTPATSRVQSRATQPDSRGAPLTELKQRPRIAAHMHIPKADSSFQTALAPGLPPCSSGMGNASCLPPCCSLALDFDLRCTIDMTCDAAAAAASAATDASPACFEEDSYGWCEHGLYGSMNFDEPTTNGGLELCKAGCAAQAECGGMYYGACSAEEAFCPNEMQHCGYCNTSYTISLPPESLGYSSTNFRSFRKVACAGATFTAEAGAHAEGWPCKNGNLNRTGCTPAIAAPAALLAPPTWRWHSEYPNDIVRATPLIDSAGGIYLSTVTSGRVVKLSKAGVEVWRWSASGTPHAQGPSADASADPLPAVPTLMGGALYTITVRALLLSPNFHPRCHPTAILLPFAHG